ncbi:MAG: peptide chain release factor N(5)-glutamine methyltransferase [Clostridiales bacterium]|jgi:release factor glutamine methyltransferase|nr:peptide chain release factor N(5)-glutamine methyltransferase [Clostridiales bacterium]
MELNVMEALKQGCAILKNNNVSVPRLEAEMLMAHLLKCQRHELYLASDRELDSSQVQQYFELIEKRASGCPVQYIINRREFMGLDFYVDQRVLIPRVDTEILVEHVIDWASRQGKGLRILDLGTGSGAIAVSLAVFIPGAHITAIDISSEALEVAKYNARLHGVEGRIAFLEGDLFSPLHCHPGMCPFDAVVFNPPYIPTGDIETLEAQVRDYEPRLALDGGADGLRFYSRLADDCVYWLKPGGLLAVEVGYGQSKVVKTIFQDTGYYQNIGTVRDLAGIERVVYATYSPDL